MVVKTEYSKRLKVNLFISVIYSPCKVYFYSKYLFLTIVYSQYAYSSSHEISILIACTIIETRRNETRVLFFFLSQIRFPNSKFDEIVIMLKRSIRKKWGSDYFSKLYFYIYIEFRGDKTRELKIIHIRGIYKIWNSWKKRRSNLWFLVI